MKRRGEKGHQNQKIPLTNFRGIELRDFSCRNSPVSALIIAEYQCDVLYRGQKDALKLNFCRLNAMNWITCGNALRLDWLDYLSSNGERRWKMRARGFVRYLHSSQPEIDFEE